LPECGPDFFTGIRNTKEEGKLSFGSIKNLMMYQRTYPEQLPVAGNVESTRFRAGKIPGKIFLSEKRLLVNEPTVG